MCIYSSVLMRIMKSSDWQKASFEVNFLDGRHITDKQCPD